MFRVLYGQNFSLFFYSLIAAIISIIFVTKYAKKQRDELGKQIPTFLYFNWFNIRSSTINFFNWRSFIAFEIPELINLSKTVYVYKGGVSIIPELISLALAFSMYTATLLLKM